MVDWSWVRKQFPVTKKYTYLNSAEGSPMSIFAATEAKRFYTEILSGGDLGWENWVKQTESVRKKVSALIGADSKEVAFTLGTSYGMNLVAEMLKGWGEVVTMDDEFPSSTFPWMNMGYKVHFVKPKSNVYSLDDIEKKISKKTKILVTSHVQYGTGFKQDLVELGKLCKKRDLVFVVNATQSIGAFPIDVKKANIDFLVFSGLKWPMAGYGIGGLYIDKKWFGKVHFPVAGWLSVKNPFLMDNKKLNLKKNASELEVSNAHFPNIFSLGGALSLLNKVGKNRVRSRIYELGDYLVKRLADLDLEIVSPLEKKYRSGIIIIRMNNAKKVVSKLRKKNIVVSARGEGIRVSVHVYNNKKDIDKFVYELKKLV